MKLPGNMQQMMRQAQQMQEKLQQEIAQIRVEATAGGGMVTIKMDGQKNMLAVKIDPEVAGDVDSTNASGESTPVSGMWLNVVTQLAFRDRARNIPERDDNPQNARAGRAGPSSNGHTSDTVLFGSLKGLKSKNKEAFRRSI